jgi:hypothetical protein
MSPNSSIPSTPHHHDRSVVVFIDAVRIVLDNPDQTGASLKQHGHIAPDHLLFLEQPGEDLVIKNEMTITLKNGSKLHSQPPADYGSHNDHHHPPDKLVRITIDGTKFSVAPKQTGDALKALAGLPTEAVLFLKQHNEDLVISNDGVVHLKDGDVIVSQIPANYGLTTLPDDHKPAMRFTEFPQPDGWLFVILHDVAVPQDYRPSMVDILVKLPPTFPDGAPDMFWTSPDLQLANGGCPRNTSHEQALGKNWQRFSWHLLPGAWRIGVSTFHDYIRCVRGRFEKKD